MPLDKKKHSKWNTGLEHLGCCLLYTPLTLALVPSLRFRNALTIESTSPLAGGR